MVMYSTANQIAAYIKMELFLFWLADIFWLADKRLSYIVCYVMQYLQFSLNICQNIDLVALPPIIVT